ncbi:iron-sulfur cluster assembly accessory protein [Nitrincola tibetensis]|uniref:Iron-sulfur cluster assembly accessory protein n=1 Tax=Nitrincola tibetensis TaxID=2219697 RepID=A0A364NI45_9GAMM|nr:iron-sulfur cluster assembly accessory protein [Nitrincola tibetensis]RAU16700.1 iron-sulfur cluster assembly accessory protein [Nitrincola tibetensis]
MSVESFDPQTQTVTVLPAALSHFRKQLASKPEAQAVRLSVKPSGCSGYMYVLDFVAESLADDVDLMVADDIRLLVDKASLPIVAGTQIDFVREGINRQIKFINPNATSECGCGESFTVSD